MEPVFVFDTTRVERLRLLAKAVSGSDDFDVDAARDDLMTCRTINCCARGVHRFTFQDQRGTVNETTHAVRFCDECWVDDDDGVCFADLCGFKSCDACGLDLQSLLDEDVPTATMVDYSCKSSKVWHNTCGTLCSVCCSFIGDKDAIVRNVANLGGQHICKECLGDMSPRKFIETNTAIIRPYSPGSLFLKLARPMHTGPRHRGTAGYARAELKKADKARLVSALAKRPAEPLAAPRKVRKSEVE